MSNRVSALYTILRSPLRILGLVLIVVFSVEVAVMLALPYLLPDSLGDSVEAVFDAVLLTTVCAPVLWLVIIGPLRRIAIHEYERSETVVAAAGDGILTFQSDGEILSCNRAASALFGREMSDLIAQRIHNFMEPFPELRDPLPTTLRLEAKKSDGQRFPVQVMVSRYPEKADDKFIAIVRDLTQIADAEQRRIQAARETEALRAQQMATLAQLATGVAHEIRNPLTSIKMLIQVNRRRFAEEGLPTDDLMLVEQEIRRMERSVNSLLDYARPETHDFESFEVEQAVRRAAQLIEGRCRAQQVALRVAAPKTRTAIFGDAAQIQQLLLNLMLNALDAMPDGGRLDLEVETTDADVVVAVRDHGSGIAPEVLHRLFTPFVTTKDHGVGLGLGICRRIAEAHRGTLTGRNEAAGGARFELTLPRHDEAQEQGSSQARRPEPQGAVANPAATEIRSLTESPAEK